MEGAKMSCLDDNWIEPEIDWKINMDSVTGIEDDDNEMDDELEE